MTTAPEMTRASRAATATVLLDALPRGGPGTTQASGHAQRIISVPLDVEAITARAEAAPGGCWEAFPDTLWIPWFAAGDDERGDEPWDGGRWLAVREFGWHTGSEDPPPELWAFLAAARDDVLSLAAEVRRLRAALATVTGMAVAS